MQLGGISFGVSFLEGDGEEDLIFRDQAGGTTYKFTINGTNP
jgi:hypothetical protein